MNPSPKSLARHFMGPTHWSYLGWYRERFGTAPALAAWLDMLLHHGQARAPNPLTGGRVFLRPGTADQAVFDEIFVAGEYAIDFGDPHVIVDAGAHIGLAAVFLASRYPRALVIAIEPEDSNFELLCRNARPHPNIRTVHAGLWSRRARLHVEDASVETWSFRVHETDAADGIPALGVGDLMQQFGLDRIDVLKMDIEGSEVEVLGDGGHWLDSVRVLVIELHDRFRPGCSAALERALAGRACKRSMSGESVVVTGLQRADPAAERIS